MAFKGYKRFNLNPLDCHIYQVTPIEFSYPEIDKHLKRANMQTTYYNKRDQKGRFTKITHQNIPAQVNKTKKLVNHFAFVIDDSGSMAHCWNKAVESLQQQLDAVFDSSEKQNQISRVSVLSFQAATNVYGRQDHCPQVDIDYLTCKAPISIQFSNTNTPLTDTINSAINHISNWTHLADDDVSYAVIIITDGEENASKNPPSALKDRIEHLKSLGNWTFAFCGPRGCKKAISNNYGIPIESIIEWETTDAGFKQMRGANVAGLTNYTASRSMGKTSVMDFYVDATKVNPTSINDLRRIYPKHRKVEKEVRIDEFFGKDFFVGKGYYELTKKELVQANKQLIIRDLNTDQYFMDSNKLSVRNFLKMPDGDVKVDPRNVGAYRIYVQSTSENRKLVRGTTMVWL